MQRFTASFLTGLLLALASCHRSDPDTNATFMLETPRADVLKQLKTSGAQIMENTESNVVADLKRPKGRQQMNVSLSFAGGVLKGVNYMPQPR